MTRASSPCTPTTDTTPFTAKTGVMVTPPRNRAVPAAAAEAGDFPAMLCCPSEELPWGAASLDLRLLEIYLQHRKSEGYPIIFCGARGRSGRLAGKEYIIRRGFFCVSVACRHNVFQKPQEDYPCCPFV